MSGCWLFGTVLALAGATPADAQAPAPPAGAENSPCLCPACPPAANAPPQLWGGADYLLWWIKAVCLGAPTLTIGNPADRVPGAVDQPGTQVVVGEHHFDFGPASGVRATLGYWFDPDARIGLEGSGFVLEHLAANTNFHSDPGGTPALFLPYQDPGSVARALPFTVPGVVAGGVSATGRSRLWGAECNIDANLCRIPWAGCCFDVTALVGFRYLDIADDVRITDTQLLVTDPAVSSSGMDHFWTRNQFYGGQVGLRVGWRGGDWNVDLIGKVAVGATHEVINVAGSPGAPLGVPGVPVPGPLFALPSNVGRTTGSDVAAVPEATVNVGYRLTQRLTVNLGWTYLGLTSIVCPGDQIDQHVNVTQLPGQGPVVGPAVPAPQFVHTDWWAHGMTLGLEFRY
jgi:hypothetical protein